MAKLFLIRHAEIARRHHGRYIGKSEVELSREGIRQAVRLGRNFRRTFSTCAVFVSPRLRCRQTWKAMGLTRHLGVERWDDLKEIDFGNWEGKSFLEVSRSHPDEVARWAKFDPGFSFPEGESLGDFTKRMKRVRDRLLRRQEKEMALITHGGVITFLIPLLLGLSPRHHLLFHVDRPSASSILIFGNGKGVLTGLNIWCDLSRGKSGG